MARAISPDRGVVNHVCICCRSQCCFGWLGHHEMSGSGFAAVVVGRDPFDLEIASEALRLGANFFYLSTWPGELLKPLSDLRFSLDLFPDRSAIATHQTLIQTCKPLGDH